MLLAVETHAGQQPQIPRRLAMAAPNAVPMLVVARIQDQHRPLPAALPPFGDQGRPDALKPPRRLSSLSVNGL